MKKILLFIGLLGIVSCRPISEEDIKKVEKKQFIIETDQYWYSFEAFKFKYDGHTYISFNGNNDISEILHDPECLKCKENESDY